MRSAFEGDFLDATDIPPGGFTVEIASIVPPGSERDKQGKNIDRTIIAFKGAKKRLIVNKTNLKIIALQYGKKASDWIGKPVTLTVRYLKSAFGQSNVPVIRIKPDESHPMTFGMRKNYGSDKPFTE